MTEPATKKFFNKSYIIALATSLLFFLISLIVNHFADIYASIRASSSVADMILDNIPVINTNGIFIYGSVIFVIFAAVLLAFMPKKIPFTVNSVALFVLIRSGFITLTHLGPPASSVLTLGEISEKFTSGASLFFSGHTGVPFLFALIFWQNVRLRWIFLACSVIAAVSVLLGHMHYSIDVAAAYFITYSIFHICQKAFKKDYALFWSDEPADLSAKPKL